MNLYVVNFVVSDDSSDYLQEFTVAESESKAEDNILHKFRGSGLRRKDIMASLVEVKGYDIKVIPTA